MTRTGRKSPGRSKATNLESRPGDADRECMIREAAYFKAEKDGFSGDSVAYWLAAEKEIDGRARRH